jgi:hypothetical protein
MQAALQSRQKMKTNVFTVLKRIDGRLRQHGGTTLGSSVESEAKEVFTAAGSFTLSL